MKFTAQEEYGLRCALNLARESSFMTVGAIAEAEGLSVQYVGKLFRILAKSALVESVRGCKGGYRLARAPTLVTVAEVLNALGGKFYEPKICERYVGDRSFCVHTNDCSIRSLWSGLQVIIDAVLSNTTLADLTVSERPMAQWIEETLVTVGQVTTRSATTRSLVSQKDLTEQAPNSAVEPGFSGREIPILRKR